MAAGNWNLVINQSTPRRLPARFEPVLVRVITPIDDNWREMGVELIQASGTVVPCRLDVQQARSLFEALGQELGAHEARTDPKKPAAEVDYATDDYPRDGCTIVIELSADNYAWRVYRPDTRVVASDIFLSSYAPRGIGSIGIAIGAFAQGKTVRSVMPEMVRAANLYQFESASRSTDTL